jgi:hypothetical protein
MIAVLRVVLLAVVALSVIVPPAAADTNRENTAEDHLSPFWGGAISQWSRWILHWADERELDPDLIAAVIRSESIGHASAEGPSGAVGLMMVMPAEKSGMSWRPSADELKKPNVNLRWGTGLLKEILRETGGDLVSALAAYNGGWEQTHLPSTQRYAHNVLTYYAYAIAARHGHSYQESKKWTLVFMTRVDGRIKRLHTETSGEFLVPCFGGAVGFRRLFPEMVDAPRVRVAHFVDEDGHDVLVDMWLFVGGHDELNGDMLVRAAPLKLTRTGHRP